MDTYQHYRSICPTPVTLGQHRACLFLVRRGFTFGVEFGFLNAQEKARDVRAGRLKPSKVAARRQRRRR